MSEPVGFTTLVNEWSQSSSLSETQLAMIGVLDHGAPERLILSDSTMVSACVAWRTYTEARSFVWIGSEPAQAGTELVSTILCEHPRTLGMTANLTYSPDMAALAEIRPAEALIDVYGRDQIGPRRDQLPMTEISLGGIVQRLPLINSIIWVQR